MSKKSFEDDIFKALSHPIRRRILRLIARKGAVSYTELSKIESKAGVLYHHLKLLGDLIYQDENKLYRLTEKGLKACELLETTFYETNELTFHKILTPITLFEKIEAWKIKLYLIIIAAASSLLWQIEKNFVLLFIFVAPYKSTIVPPFFVAILSWIGSAIILSLIVEVIFQRRCYIQDLLPRMSIVFILINLYPVLISLFQNTIIRIIIFFILQIFGLLLTISAVSATAKISLRKSGLTVIALHYLSIIIYFILITIE